MRIPIGRFIPFFALPLLCCMVYALLHAGCSAREMLEAKRFEPLTENLSNHSTEARPLKGGWTKAFRIP